MSLYGSPLKPGSIRLLRLMPHEYERTEIQCELFEYALQDPSKGTHLYESLSYTWGGSDRPCSIFVNKQKFSVTENLYAALFHLQDRSLQRILWVDAICINQKNLKEQGLQVQLMANIYSRAARVLVWLGETARDSDTALERLRVAAEYGSTNSLDDKEILALLERPWFQRIWVLQEVAAARHILIICGSTAIDGYTFFLGVNYFYEARPDLESSIRPITNLIRGAIFRPKHLISSSGRASLNIHPLRELIDMFHTYKASNPLDKVYALLAMSSDDLSTADLLPNYEILWENLLKNLVKFLLHKQVYVKTWGNEERAVIKSKGCILGQVLSVQSDDRRKVNIIFKNMPEHLGHKREWQACWTLQASAKHIQKCDIICLLQGAPEPMIIRPCRDYFNIIRITASPEESGDIEWSKLLQSVTVFPRDFLLVWDWGNSLEKVQDHRGYETLIQTNYWMAEYSEIGPESCLEEVIRIWNIALILEDLEEFKKAEETLQDAIKCYKRMIGANSLHTPQKKYGLTLLSLIARNGHDKVVKLLLAKDIIDSDLKDSQYSRTPLSWAAEGGHEAVVKLLLETGKVEVDAKDSSNRTPLSWAAGGGHEAVVKLLLETGKVEVDTKDNYYSQTPLSWAAKGGYEAVVKLLLETGKVEIDIEDNHYSRTPLLWAAKGGHETVVKLLLETGKVEIDMKDNHYSRTLLSYAAEGGYETVVKLLLETGKVEIDTKDSSYQTPFSWAARGGHEAVVKLLLETGKVEVDKKDRNNRTPLSWAARGGNEAVVKLLLETGKVNIDAEDISHETPLAWAAKGGYEAVVKLLLETGKIEADAKDSHNRTPLSRAAKGGHEAVVKLLLETGEVEVNVKDNHYGRTPLSCAAEGGHEAVIKLLLETGKVEVDIKDYHYSRTSLSWAARGGHEAVVRLLLETGKAEVDAKDSSNRTPLSWAAGGGYEAVVKLLLETGKIEADAKDSHNRTPLSRAAEGGHKAVVKLLLETGKVEVDTKDSSNRTPLSWAARGGHKAVVKLLLETGKVEVDTKDSINRTPLSWAARGGHEAMVKLLQLYKK